MWFNATHRLRERAGPGHASSRSIGKVGMGECGQEEKMCSEGRGRGMGDAWLDRP